MTFCGHIGLHPDFFADCALDRKTTAVDFRFDAFDNDPFSNISYFLERHLST
jgi:hypothetical protein